jgi:aspartyl-tRNA(Asn)/glutamyl-tRNA(Gln) amidotransferase subunit A
VLAWGQTRCHFGIIPAGGLPVGLQLAGRPFPENMLLRLGTLFQEATSWHKQKAKMRG